MFIKIWNTYTPQSINYINNYVVYCCLDMYNISYQITKPFSLFNYGLQPISGCILKKTVNGYDKL